MTHVIEDIVEDGQGNVVSRRVLAEGSDEHKRRCVARIENDLAHLDRRIAREGGNEEILRALRSLGAVLSPFVIEVLDQKDALRAERDAIIGG